MVDKVELRSDVQPHFAKGWSYVATLSSGRIIESGLVLVETIPEKRKTVSSSLDEETDPNTLRGREIKRLAELASLAYKNCTNKNLKMGIRENWHKRYTNHVLALNVLLKDSQLKDYEERMKIIEEHERRRGATYK